MPTKRRRVRVAPSFFEDLDRQLDTERGPAGEPSAQDFQVYELLRVVEEFATDFDDMPRLFDGRDEYRILITAGILVPRLSVVGQLSADGAVELVELDLDLDTGWE